MIAIEVDVPPTLLSGGAKRLGKICTNNTTANAAKAMENNTLCNISLSFLLPRKLRIKSPLVKSFLMCYIIGKAVMPCCSFHVVWVGWEGATAFPPFLIGVVMSELVANEPIRGELRTNAYIPSEAMDFEEWQKTGDLLTTFQKSINWWVGDWLLHGEKTWPDKFSQAVYLTGKSDVTLRNAAWVSRVFPPDERHPDLSYSHHFEVASVKSEEERRWLLNEAVEKDLSSAQLRKLRNNNVGDAPELPPLDMPDHMSDDLRSAVSGFMEALAVYKPRHSDEEVKVKLPWGRVEMRFVKEIMH